ncbi:MAG: metallophosphoesterase family protein [Pseudomonadota bacterium]
MKLLKRFRRSDDVEELPRQQPGTANAPRPAETLFVIGDIHGRRDLLEKCLEQIDSVIGELSVTDPRLVFVGDYVDRGPDSRGVLLRLHELSQNFPNHVNCLLGNHEQMLLDFLDAPVARQARWLRNGGAETLASFGLSVPDDPGLVDGAVELAQALRSQLGREIESWLQGLDVKHSSGNVHVVHAGIDPGRSIHNQLARIMVWGHPEFLSRERSDGQWIAHGHTIVPSPVFGKGRISVDTGAWKTDILTAAMVRKDGRVKFLGT